MPVRDYSTSPAANTSISGIDIAENCLAANMNNAVRQLMADVKTHVAHVSVKEFGALGNDSADDQPAIQAAIDYASSIATSDGQRVKVIIPPGKYRCYDEIVPKSNTAIENQGELIFYGGNALGGFVVPRAQSNVELYGGVWNSNEQGNDNCIAISFVNPDQSIAGPACDGVWIHDLTIKKCRHGGSHIADATDPSQVGTGGGKGITIQFGCKRVFVNNVKIDDCDIGFSIEGKETDSAYGEEITFSNMTVNGSRYIGAMLGSVPNTFSLSGTTTGVVLDNITFRDCANGQTLEAVPQDVADLFGVIVGQSMVSVVGNIKVVNSTGKTTLFRGSFRFADWKVDAIVNNLADAINTAAYEGHNPQNLASRYNNFDIKLAILGTTFSGYLVNCDVTYGDIGSCHGFKVLNGNGGTFASVSSAKYKNNYPSTGTFMLKDMHSGRLIVANDAADPTLTSSNVLTWLNGLGLEDDSTNNLTKLVPGRGNLALADNAGTTNFIIETGRAVAQNKFGLRRSSDLTIATGAITVTASNHRVDTEAAAAADDLDTINGNANESLLILKCVSAARVVTVKHNTGNIRLAGGADFAFNNVYDRLVLEYDGVNGRWVELSRSDNA